MKLKLLVTAPGPDGKPAFKMVPTGSEMTIANAAKHLVKNMHIPMGKGRSVKLLFRNKFELMDSCKVSECLEDYSEVTVVINDKSAESPQKQSQS